MGADLISVVLRVAVALGTVAGICFLLQRIKKRRKGSTSQPTQPINDETAIPDEELSTEEGDIKAEDAWERKDYQRLLSLLEKDSRFPVGFSLDEVNAEESLRDQLKNFVEGRERLHYFIRNGDLPSIKKFTRDNKSTMYYSIDNVSALSRAIEFKKKEICSHFSTFRENIRVPEGIIEKSNWLKFWEESHIHKLVSATRFSVKPNREEYAAIINMYLELDKHKYISCLFKAIQNEDFVVSFAIRSENVTTERYGIPIEVFGYTEKSGRIFIAGKGINTVAGYKNVYRVFAHEFCHLAMHFMYRNDFKPYHPHDEERELAFTYLCREIHKKHHTMDSLIEKVYSEYGEKDWNSELVVRVPEIVAVHGEKEAPPILEKLISLHKYYEEHIVTDCLEFSDSLLYSTELLNLKNISQDHLVLRGSDMPFSPFVKTENYKDYLIPWKFRGLNFFLLPTSNPKLCAMHVLYECKRSFPLHLDRRCLAFKMKYYYEKNNGEVISNAFESPGFRKLILLMHDAEGNYGSERIFDDIYFGSTEEKEVIVVVSAELCNKHPEWHVQKKLEYHWEDLSEKYRDEMLKKEIFIQGERIHLGKVFEKHLIPQVITLDVLSQIVSKNELRIGELLSSTENKGDLYIERNFTRFVYRKENFLKKSHYLYITGVSEDQFSDQLIDQFGDQWTKEKEDILQIINPEDEIKGERHIYLQNDEKNNVNLFKGIFSKIEEKGKPFSFFWIHHENRKYSLRESLGRRDEIEGYFEEESLDENKIVERTERERVVLVADSPGTGKSTAVRSVMKKMKNKYPEKLICRINFGEHLTDPDDALPLHSVRDSSKEILGFLQRVCKINTQLEKEVFKHLQGISERIIIFFDGYDEISSKLQKNALQFLKTLKDTTKINMWVITRKHEQLALEVELNPLSFSLKPFNMDDQQKYLNCFWVRQLTSLDTENEVLGKRFQEIVMNLKKYSVECGRLVDKMNEVLISINKENEYVFQNRINDLDFSDYSIMVINSVKENILKGQSIVPLWLWMTATVILNSNLKIPNKYDKFTFYTDFMEKAVDSFLRGKCKMAIESNYQEKEYRKGSKRIYENLWKFSELIIRPELCKEKLENEYLEELVDTGLLMKKGENYYFFHKTFAEFFYSQKIITDIKSEKLASVNAELISDILLKESYLEVRIFLDDLFEKDKGMSVIFPKILLQQINLSETYIRCCQNLNFSSRRLRDKTGCQVWRRIFQDCEIHFEKSANDDFISKLLNSEILRSYPGQGFVEFLDSTLSDKMLCKIFDLRADELCWRSCLAIYREDSNVLSSMLKLFQRVTNYQNAKLQLGTTSENSNGNVKEKLEILKMECSNERYIPSLPLKSKINIFLVSSVSNNSNAFIVLLRFASELMKREEISELLRRTTDERDSVVHLMTKTRKGNILNDLREIRTVRGEDELCKLLMMQNENGMTMLHNLMTYSKNTETLAKILEYIGGVMEIELLWKFLLLEDNLGRSFLFYADILNIEVVMEFLEHHLSKEKIIEFLIKSKKEIHNSFRKATCLLREITHLEKYFGKEIFQEMLVSKDWFGRTRLHCLVRIFYKNVNNALLSDLTIYSELLDDNSLKNFLISQDNDGETLLHYLAKREGIPHQRNILDKLQSILSPDAYEQLTNIIN